MMSRNRSSVYGRIHRTRRISVKRCDAVIYLEQNRREITDEDSRKSFIDGKFYVMKL